VSAGFTKGPWSRHECFDPTGKRLTSRDIVPPGGHSLNGVAVLASVFSNDADARLIAAAPELYEALRQCRLELDYCQQQLAARGQTGHPEDSVSRALKAGRAALAKARGEAA
jgi:hypothetical protein